MTTATNGGEGARIASSTRNVLVAVAGYAVPAVLLAMGAARMASLSGELPGFDPTDAEIEIWNVGNALRALGGIVLLLWSALILILRARLKFTAGSTAAIIAGGIIGNVLVAGVVWMLVLPPLPIG